MTGSTAQDHPDGGLHYATHSIWSDTGKTMCGRFVPTDAIDEYAPTCKTCCKALEYHFGDDDA